jgi:hypothetical protein
MLVTVRLVTVRLVMVRLATVRLAMVRLLLPSLVLMFRLFSLQKHPKEWPWVQIHIPPKSAKRHFGKKYAGNGEAGDGEAGDGEAGDGEAGNGETSIIIIGSYVSTLFFAEAPQRMVRHGAVKINTPVR